MDLHVRSFFQKPARELSVCFLAFFWCFFLFLGFKLAAGMDLNGWHIVRYEQGIITIFVSFLTDLFSLVLTFLAIRFKLTTIIFLSASFRGFCYGYLLSVYLTLFSSAGWLICLLDFLSSTVLNVLLLSAWTRYLFADKHSFRLFSWFISIIVLTVFDLFVITPYINLLIKNF